jgi:hypothetical protein
MDRLKGMKRKGSTTISRVAKHEIPKQRVAARLRRMGLKVQLVTPNLAHDLLVEDQLRVALRVAFPGKRQHRVTVAGRSYRYRYDSWHFNFHHHGQMRVRYTDFFVCIAVSAGGTSRSEVFVIPWEGVRGKTFSLHAGRRRYAGQYARYRDAWQSIQDASRREGDRLAAVA